MTPKREADFCRSMAWLLEAGLDLPRALSALEDRKRPWIAELGLRLRSGQSLSAALEDLKVLSPLTTAFLSAGEKTGNLPRAFSGAAECAARSSKVRTALLTAALYPSLLFLLTSGALIFLSVTALPRYEALFAGQNVVLPALTRGLFAWGRWMASGGWLVVLALGILLIWALFRGRLGVWCARLPLLGGFARQTALVQGLSLLSGALDSGVDLRQALTFAGRGCGLPRQARLYGELSIGLSLGGGLTGQKAAAELWPRWVVLLLSAGEESRRLAESAARAAEQASADLERFVKRRAALMEPALILIIGLFVGLTAWGLFTPLMAAVEVLAR